MIAQTGHPLKTAAEVALARTAPPADPPATPDLSRLRIASLYDVAPTGQGSWVAVHREQDVTFVCRRGDRRGQLFVESGSGNTYRIDWDAGSCTCPDHARRQRCCKHLTAATAVADFCAVRRAERERAAA